MTTLLAKQYKTRWWKIVKMEKNKQPNNFLFFLTNFLNIINELQNCHVMSYECYMHVCLAFVRFLCVFLFNFWIDTSTPEMIFYVFPETSGWILSGSRTWLMLYVSWAILKSNGSPKLRDRFSLGLGVPISHWRYIVSCGLQSVSQSQGRRADE